jgi:hypothetical protein
MKYQYVGAITGVVIKGEQITRFPQAIDGSLFTYLNHDFTH